MGQPNINITFSTLARTLFQRGSKGTIAMILKDSAGEGEYTIFSQADIPQALSADSRDAIQRALIGNEFPPEKILLKVLPVEGELSDGLDWAGLQTFDYLCGPLDITTPDTTTVVDWIKEQRAAGRKSKAVLPDTAADHEGIINFSATGIQVASGTLTAAQYCSRIAGILAGTSFEQSATYVTLPEVLDAGRLTRAEADTAEEAGKLVILYDGQKFKTGRAVNSLVTTAEGKGDAFKKIKIVEVMDLIKQDITLTAEDYYVGKYPNSYDSRCLLISAIKGYLDSLAADQILGPGPLVEIDVDANRKWLSENGFSVAEMSDQEIKVANTGSTVNLKATIQILDVIEDISLPILLAQ